MKKIYLIISVFFIAVNVEAKLSSDSLGNYWITCYVDPPLSDSALEAFSFVTYSDFLRNGLDITVSMPEKFTDLRYFRSFRISDKEAYGMFYCPIIQSNDKNCLLLYNKQERDSYLERPRVQITQELKSAYGIRYVHEYQDSAVTDRAVIDFDAHVSIFAGQHVRERFNADTLYVYDIPMDRSVLGHYVYCTGVAIMKKGMACIYLKCLFTEDGKQDKEKYIDLLSETIRYNDGEWKYNRELYDKTSRKYAHFKGGYSYSSEGF